MGELDLFVNLSVIAGESALVVMTILIWKEIGHIEEIFRFTKMQGQPWVGPSDGEIVMDTNRSDGKDKFAIKLKNFGKSPAKNVTGHFISQNTAIDRGIFQDSNILKFNMGPLLPNMEKSYWFFIDSNIVQKARDKSEDLFIGIYFSYEYSGMKSGYGIIGHFDSISNNFIKTQMWEE